jgi:hypothetical protein
MSGHNDQTLDKQGGASGIAARFFWMLIGNAVLAFSIVAIGLHKGDLFYTVDLVFWITIPVLAVVRYVDIRFLGGLTATDKPASMTHWRRYVVLLLACSGVVWAITHAANYLFVNR